MPHQVQIQRGPGIARSIPDSSPAHHSEPGCMRLWAPSQYKDGLSMYGIAMLKDKTVARPSYLYHGDPYSGKTTCLY